MALCSAEPFILANAQLIYFHGPHVCKIKSILVVEVASSDQRDPMSRPGLVHSARLARLWTDRWVPPPSPACRTPHPATSFTSFSFIWYIATPDVTPTKMVQSSLFDKKLFFFSLSKYSSYPFISQLALSGLLFAEGSWQLSAAVLQQLLHSRVMRDSLRASFMPSLTLKPIPTALGSNEPPLCQQK